VIFTKWKKNFDQTDRKIIPATSMNASGDVSAILGDTTCHFHLMTGFSGSLLQTRSVLRAFCGNFCPVPYW
jgi:hypothetical protein